MSQPVEHRDSVCSGTNRNPGRRSRAKPAMWERISVVVAATTTEIRSFPPALDVFYDVRLSEALDTLCPTAIVFLSTVRKPIFWSVRFRPIRPFPSDYSIAPPRARLHQPITHRPSISTESIVLRSRYPSTPLRSHGAVPPNPIVARRRNWGVFHHTHENPG